MNDLCCVCGKVGLTLTDDIGRMVCKDCFGSMKKNHKSIVVCSSCLCGVKNEDAVWIDEETGKASTGDQATPFHIECAPEEY